MNERRRHPRICCRVGVHIKQYGLINAAQLCYTGNISMKGLFMPDIPHRPVGTSCQLIIHDAAQPLEIPAKVSHFAPSGVGFAFTNQDRDDCPRLSRLIQPQWDGRDYLEGMMLIFRYSEQTTNLKDCLSLTGLLSSPGGAFGKVKKTHCKKNH